MGASLGRRRGRRGAVRAPVMCSLVGLILSVALMGCGSSSVSLRGRVVDDRGQPLGGATIETIPPTDVVLSAPSSGEFLVRDRISEAGAVESIRPGEYHLRIRKPGFDDATFRIDVEGGRIRLGDLVLRPRAINATEPGKGVDKTDPAKGSTNRTLDSRR